MIVRIFSNDLYDDPLTIMKLLQREIYIEHLVFEPRQQAKSLYDYSAFLGMYNHHAPNKEVWVTLTKNINWGHLNIENLSIVDVEKKELLYLMGRDVIQESFVYFLQLKEVKYDDPALWNRFIQLVLLVEQECTKLEQKGEKEHHILVLFFYLKYKALFLLCSSFVTA